MVKEREYELCIKQNNIYNYYIYFMEVYTFFVVPGPGAFPETHAYIGIDKQLYMLGEQYLVHAKVSHQSVQTISAYIDTQQRIGRVPIICNGDKFCEHVYMYK